VTGAVYEIGCLRAIEDMLDRSMLDLDLYVGVSGGAFVASLLAAGVSPYEMYNEVAGETHDPLGVADAPLFRLRLGEFLKSSSRAPRLLSSIAASTLRRDGQELADLALSLFQLLPAGLVDNSGIRDYIRGVLRQRGHADRFRDLRRALYIVAVDLDSGEALAFGEPGRRDVAISKAVQASTALPGLYQPVRIGGRDYVDGGVKKTAHINLAIRHGADLVIVVNPIVPIRNGHRGPLDGPISRKGIGYVLDQVFRIMLHGRMEYGLERYRKEHPDVDILVLQPERDDMRMFSYNIMRYSARRVVAQHGYRSALAHFRRNRAAHARLLARHGIALRDLSRLPDQPSTSPYRSQVARNLGASLDFLVSRLRTAPS
jgi:predicted acylesterase/phospholipase RssA